MATWTVKDAVTNLFEEGTYQMRLESSTHGMSKGNDKNPPTPVIKWTWVNVTPGEYEGKKSFQTFTMRTDLLGIIGAALAGTQAFDENEELPDDAEELARICESKLGGKVFEIEYCHNQPKNSTRVFSDMKIIGPTAGNFG